jgi:hypothetical protein
MASDPDDERPQRAAPTRSHAGLIVVLLLATAMGAGVALELRVPRAPRVNAPPPGSTSERTLPPPAESAPPELPSRAVTDAGATASAAPEPAAPYVELDGGTLQERNDVLITNMQRALGLSDSQVAAIRRVFAGSDFIGQGNPTVSHHPLTRTQCLERRAEAKRLPAPALLCGAPNMVPLYDPSAGETPASAKVCIDQYEFPNIECEYPVVWVRANEAQELCHAVGKRLCDAHEWEGACAGALKSPDSEYAWGERRIMMQYLHNKSREIVWAYGKEKNHALCATGSKKGPHCLTPSWNGCGTNDYPAGSFPECASPLGVFDLHGNAAEHMNFPMKPEELGSRGGSGDTEMKGSWFIFLQAEAHEDDCRWRAPDWHVTRIDDPNSHRNYHLGFRCCRDLEAPDAGASAPDAATQAERDAGAGN